MYPSPTEMEDLGKSLGLTVNEVRGWFKRRRSRRKDGKSLANDRSLMRSSTSSRCDFGAGVEKRCSQRLLTSQHILAKIFRKDGPLLGSEFDHLPSGARKGMFYLFGFVADKGYMRCEEGLDFWKKN